MTTTILSKAHAERLWESIHQLAGIGSLYGLCGVVVEPAFTASHDEFCWVTRGLPLLEAQ